jgi:3-methyladenine DNA glycosylase AlkC
VGEPFKNLLNAARVRDSAAVLARHARGFDGRLFVARATAGLEALEMKARAMQIADALEATLPARFADAADALEAGLAPAAPGDAMPQIEGVTQGLRGWILWPVGEYIARRGIDEPERALAALHALTQRFTAEFAIRPFIVRHPGVVWPTLARWCRDDSAHVRRLVSEGSRPRLPWGLQLKGLIADPSPTLPLLQALQDDPSEYVRRSVANHLNDIAKDHPALVCAWVQQHLPGATAERTALLRHASRTLVKRGHAPMLALWGVGRPLRGEASLVLAPRRVAIGQGFELRVTLRSTARRGTQPLAVDYRVHHLKAGGGHSAKVFKGWQLELPPGSERVLAKAHSMRPVTTRRYVPGPHRVEVQVNGRVVATAGFELLPSPSVQSGR